MYVYRPKEELSELHKKAFKRTRPQLAAVIAIRTTTNLIVIVTLMLSGGAIYFATIWSWKEVTMHADHFIGHFIYITTNLKKKTLQRIEISSTPLNTLDGSVPVVLKAFLVPIVMNALELVLPWFFELVVQIEKFKTRSGEVAMTMIRTAVVRIGNLGTYTVLLHTVISCTQQTGEAYLPTYSSNKSCVKAS